MGLTLHSLQKQRQCPAFQPHKPHIPTGLRRQPVLRSRTAHTLLHATEADFTAPLAGKKLIMHQSVTTAAMLHTY